MGLIGALSNRECEARIRRLQHHLGRVSSTRRQSRLGSVPSPRRSGTVSKAVVAVLAAEGQPMRSQDVQAAVEQLLGELVPRGTVKQALSAGAR